MNAFEITVQRKDQDTWPVVIRHEPGAHELTLWSRGRLEFDPEDLVPLLPSQKDYGLRLGKALFREEVRDAFVRAVAEAKAADEHLRVLLNIEDDDLRCLHWEQLCAPLDRGWDYLLLNQPTPFSLYLPSQIQLRFPPIGRRDLRALLLVAGPEELDGDYGLHSFDVAATVDSLRRALGPIPCDVLASVEGASGLPRLDVLCAQITARAGARAYTLLHIVCHGAYLTTLGETILYYPMDEGRRPVPATDMIEALGRLGRLPHLTFLSTCASATPNAEAGLGGLGQRLVRELGMPAVVAMTDRVSIATAQALATSFYAHLGEHGEVDLALIQALAGLQGRYDITVPALFSRLGGRPLFSDTLDRALTGAEISYGLEQARALAELRAPVLLAELDAHAATLKASFGAEAAALSPQAQRELQAALAAVNQLCNDALDLSFNALALGQKPPDYDARCPFRGLYPFRAEDQEFFYGREAPVDKLARRIEEHRFLAVLGPSGCGKSSLVLAGLVPALQRQTPGLRVVYLQPGSDPPAQLEAALASGGGEAGTKAGSGDGQPPLIVVDQFEELFTLCSDGSKRQAFVDSVLALSRTSPIVLTLRADFWGECALYPALKEEMQAHQELVGPMDAVELRGAMERQAGHVGLRFEAGLSEDVLDDVQGEPGAMPLLQHALLLLWHRRHGRWLRWEEYRAIGGIRQAIAHTAEEVCAGLSDAGRERMRDIFLRLTRLEDSPAQGEVRDTRRRVGLAELVPAGGDAAATVALVKRLADARLVVTSLNAASAAEEVEVAHEALIRHWPRLRSWLDEDRATLRLRQDVRDAALEWQAHGHDETYLVHRGGRLEDAELLGKGQRFGLNELEQAYVDTCVAMRERERREKEEQQRRELEAARKLAAEQRARAEEQAAGAARMRRRAVVIGTVGVVAVVLAVLSMLFWSEAQNSAATATANLAVAVTNEAKANAESTRAVANEAEANTQRAIAVTNEAQANAESTRAVANAATAQAHARTAQARGLAALATNQLDEHLDLALLLAIEAFRTESLPQTRQALFAAWSHNPRLSRFVQQYPGRVGSMAWSPDGRLAAAICGSRDEAGKCTQGEILIWDWSQAGVESGQPTQTLRGHQAEIGSLTWSPDGRLASGSCAVQGGDGNCLQGEIILWDIESDQPQVTLRGHVNSVASLAWSEDGRLASGSCGEHNEQGNCTQDEIVVWDLGSGQPIQTLHGDQPGVPRLAWSPGGKLAFAVLGYPVTVWDFSTAGPESGRPAELPLEGNRQVTSLAWSPDERLSFGAMDGTVTIWNAASGQVEQTLSGHKDWVVSVAWLFNGQLASGSSDRSVIIWDLKNSRPKEILQGHTNWVSNLAWWPDGKLASASADGSVILWDPEGSPAEKTVEGPAKRLAWSTAGRLASVSDGGAVILWDLAASGLGSGEPTQVLYGHTDWVHPVAWSAGGQLASGSCGSRESYNCTQGEIIVWDLGGGEPAQILYGHADWIDSLAWSTDGRLASGSRDQAIIIWDLDTAQPVQTLHGHSDQVDSLAWSRDGRLASSGLNDATIIVWDVTTGLPIETWTGISGSAKSLAWSPDGRLAAGLSDDAVIVWDPKSDRPFQVLQGHRDCVAAVAWSEDGRLASASGDAVIVWDLASGQPEEIVDRHLEWVSDVICTGSVGWLPRVKLGLGSYGRPVQIWPMDPQVWIAQACQRAGRNLTAAEWVLYFPAEAYRRTCEEWPVGE